MSLTADAGAVELGVDVLDEVAVERNEAEGRREHRRDGDTCSCSAVAKTTQFVATPIILRLSHSC